ncbi:MAG TPA: hypothetical protein PLB10_07850 [Thiolinea sp.]|nr:hypothetical protein [Thiolinea sp.]
MFKDLANLLSDICSIKKWMKKDFVNQPFRLFCWQTTLIFSHQAFKINQLASFSRSLCARYVPIFPTCPEVRPIALQVVDSKGGKRGAVAGAGRR